MIRVVLADDEALMRAGVAAILGSDPGIEVVAEAGDGRAAVSQALAETAVKLKSDETLNAQTIRAAIEKRFDTGYIDNPKPSDIEVTKVDRGWMMKADYETTVPMFGNLYLLMTFKQAVVIN